MCIRDRAISVRDLRRLGIVAHTVGDEPVLFVAVPDTDLTAVFSRRLDDTVAEVDLVGRELIDRETGNRWDAATGISRSGEADLERLPSLSTFAEDFPNHFPDGELLDP